MSPRRHYMIACAFDQVPVGEVPAALFRELDDLSNTHGQGDLRATTRQAFQLHGVIKGNLKHVIASIANVGSNTYGGCGDINRNIMAPPVTFYDNPAYEYCMQYSRAIADLFKPMTESFNELWLNGEKAATVEYYRRVSGAAFESQQHCTPAPSLTPSPHPHL